MGRLDDEVAIVTGAAQGLGRAFALTLEGEGALVTACDVRSEVLDLASERIHPEVANVSLSDCVRRVVDGTLQRHGRVDVLVNNAAVLEPTPIGTRLEDLAAAFDHQVAHNLRSAYLMGRAVLEAMMDQAHGHIVNVSTDHVHPAPDRTNPGNAVIDAYDATKWALHGLTGDWANTGRSKGVRVNALCMGATDTEMLRRFRRDFQGMEVTDEEAATWLRPEQVADVLVQLLAESPDGRTDEAVGLWVGHPVTLPPRRPE